MTLDRSALLQKRKLPQRSVYIPALGDSVIVQGMTAKGRSQFEKSLQDSKGKADKSKQQEIRERLVIACCVDEAGQTLFTEADIDALGQQPAEVLEPIVNAAQELCGMTSEDIDDLAKNSQTTASDG